MSPSFPERVESLAVAVLEEMAQLSAASVTDPPPNVGRAPHKLYQQARAACGIATAVGLPFPDNWSIRTTQTQREWHPGPGPTPQTVLVDPPLFDPSSILQHNPPKYVLLHESAGRHAAEVTFIPHVKDPKCGIDHLQAAPFQDGTQMAVLTLVAPAGLRPDKGFLHKALYERNGDGTTTLRAIAVRGPVAEDPRESAVYFFPPAAEGTEGPVPVIKISSTIHAPGYSLNLNTIWPCQDLDGLIKAVSNPGVPPDETLQVTRLLQATFAREIKSLGLTNVIPSRDPIRPDPTSAAGQLRDGSPLTETTGAPSASGAGVQKTIIP